MYRKQTKMVLHKTFMAITSSPGHKHDRVHKFIKICKVLCKMINLRFIFAIDYTQSKEQHLNQWVKEKDPTSCIILSLLYLSMYFTSQQLCLYRYIVRTRPVDQHTYWHTANAIPSVHLQLWQSIQVNETWFELQL